jgi:hypothetical protein
MMHCSLHTTRSHALDYSLSLPPFSYFYLSKVALSQAGAQMVEEN